MNNKNKIGNTFSLEEFPIEAIRKGLKNNTIGKKGVNILNGHLDSLIVQKLGFDTIEYELFGESFKREIQKQIKEEYRVKSLKDIPNENHEGKELLEIIKGLKAKTDKVFSNKFNGGNRNEICEKKNRT